MLYKIKSKGFTLIGVLMGTAITGIIAVVLMKYMGMASKTTKTFDSNNDITSILNQTRNYLTNAQNCNLNFAGLNASSTASGTISNIQYRDTTGTPVTKFKTISTDATALYGAGKVKINSFSLSDATDEVSVTDFNSTNLNISFDRGNGLGVQTISKKITLSVKVDGTGLITQCKAASNMTGEIWKKASNNIDSFFNGGNVSIGKDEALVKLDVKGNVKVGDEAATCTATGELNGTIRLDKPNRTLLYCSNGTWNKIASAGYETCYSYDSTSPLPGCDAGEDEVDSGYGCGFDPATSPRWEMGNGELWHVVKQGFYSDGDHYATLLRLHNESGSSRPFTKKGNGGVYPACFYHYHGTSRTYYWKFCCK